MTTRMPASPRNRLLIGAEPVIAPVERDMAARLARGDDRATDTDARLDPEPNGARPVGAGRAADHDAARPRLADGEPGRVDSIEATEGLHRLAEGGRRLLDRSRRKKRRT